MRAARWSWTLFAVTCLCVTGYLVLDAYPDPRLFSTASLADGFPVIPLGVLLTAWLGALILGRHPRHRVGWLLLAGAAGTSLNFVASAGAYRFLTGPVAEYPALGHGLAWLSQFFGATYALGFTCLLFLVVPDGRLLSRRWWAVLVALVASYALWAGVLLVGVSPRQVGPGGVDAGPVATGLLDLSSLLLVLSILAAAVSLVVRLRRSTGVQRQQLRWILASASLLAGGVLVLIGYQSAAGGPGEPWYVSLPLFLGYASLPVFTGIAVLRYRLYDLDLIINRAVVLAVLTTFVTAGYVVVVVTIGAVLGSHVATRFWPSLVALVVVALAFQPLRQRVLRLADRLVYGHRAAPYEALADFSRRIGMSRAPSDLLPALAEAVAHTVGAAYTRVTMDIPGTSGLSARWPGEADRSPDVEYEACDGDEALGRIEVWTPPKRRLRRSERRLLTDIAAQAAVAFRNLRLDAELQARVEHLGRQSDELAASRRRLLAARDDERQRVADMIEREVLSYLRPLPAAIESVDLRDTTTTQRRLAELEAATAAALDALREVTRGLFPVLLTTSGLIPALLAHVGRQRRDHVLHVDPAVSAYRWVDMEDVAAALPADVREQGRDQAAGGQ